MPFSTFVARHEAKSLSSVHSVTCLFNWPDASSSLHDSIKLGIPSMYSDAMAEAVKESDDGSSGNW